MDQKRIQKLVLFMPPFSQYNVLHHFTKQMHAAFERAGIDCRLIEAKYNNPKPFLEELFKDKPDATFSFNGLLPDDKGNFFADMVKIPHIACLVDSPNRYLKLITSQYTIVTCPDHFGCEFFQGINFKKVLHLPHGVGKDETHPSDSVRPYDVVLLASCLDYENVLAGWRKQFSPALCEAMEEAVEVTLSDNHTPYVQAFVSAVDRQLSKGAPIDTAALNYPTIFEAIEDYLRAKDRIELVKSIKNAKVDIFGEGTPTANWKKVLGDQKNVTIHKGVDFMKAMEIMKQSKILINCNPVFKEGADERIFTGISLGALVITNDNSFIRKHFEDKKSIVLYKFGDWKDFNDKIDYYLAHEKERQAIVNKGKDIVAKHHTWDNRAHTLLKELPAFLQT